MSKGSLPDFMGVVGTGRPNRIIMAGMQATYVTACNLSSALDMASVSMDRLHGFPRTLQSIKQVIHQQLLCSYSFKGPALPFWSASSSPGDGTLTLVQETELIVIHVPNKTRLYHDTASGRDTVLRTHYRIPALATVSTVGHEANALLSTFWSFGRAEFGVVGDGLFVLVPVVLVVLDWDGVESQRVFSEAVDHCARDTSVVPRKNVS